MTVDYLYKCASLRKKLLFSRAWMFHRFSNQAQIMQDKSTIHMISQIAFEIAESRRCYKTQDKSFAATVQVRRFRRNFFYLYLYFH
jgi:hypothetical protein